MSAQLVITGASNYAQGEAAAAIAPGATFTDAVSNLGGGSLTVSFSGTSFFGDELHIINQGSAAGQIGLEPAGIFGESDVTYGGQVIGTAIVENVFRDEVVLSKDLSAFTGTSQSGISVSFNSSATPQAVQALVQDIAYFERQASIELDVGTNESVKTGTTLLGKASSQVEFVGHPQNIPGTNQTSEPDRTVQFTINDGHGSTFSSTGTVTFVAGLQPPTFVAGATAVGDEQSAIPLSITAPSDNNDDPVSITISGVPSDAALSAGTRNGDGSWTLTAAQLPGLTFLAGETSASLTVTATAAANNPTSNSSVTSTQSIAVTVDPQAEVPNLSVPGSVSGVQGAPIGLGISVS
ncbi:MAG: hypothetical protein KGO48_10995, partial [Alphaproteobacteria bacterium]|nr:hypothetical protein [Alphaproteobacteria bacterium]